MSPLIMYMTSSLGSTWNSLRCSRPRATNAMLSGACQSTVLGREEWRMPLMTWPRSTARISAMVHRVVSRVAQHAARIAARVRPLLQQDFAVRHGVVDALGELAHPPPVARKVVHDVFRHRPHGVGIEDDEVGDHPRLQQPAVVDPEGRGRIEGEPAHGVLERHDLLLSDP